jgi:dTDP-glucose 4,6-dehydratase
MLPVKDRKGHDRRHSVDISKIHPELGILAPDASDTGLEQRTQRYRDGAWWQPVKVAA